MAKMKDFSQPVRDGGIKLVELARKKVVYAFHHDKMILTRQRRNHTFDPFYGAVLVSTSVDEELRLLALSQERKIGAVDWSAKTNQVANSYVFAADA